MTLPNTSDTAWPQIWTETLEASAHWRDIDISSGKALSSINTPDCIQPTTSHRSRAGNEYTGPGLSRGNLTVLTEVMVHKVLFKKISAGLELRVCSPALLERSGVGRAEALAKLGVEVLIDNANVGENLQNHVTCGMAYEVEGDT
ncbi:Oxygen-dependent choline dehydrogenase [Paramyrothecium foliicola]|nr:Oxygen-dependent choline dehydrogenase [Paramyrothecium foliicola]